MNPYLKPIPSFNGLVLGATTDLVTLASCGFFTGGVHLIDCALPDDIRLSPKTAFVPHLHIEGGEFNQIFPDEILYWEQPQIVKCCIDYPQVLKKDPYGRVGTLFPLKNHVVQIVIGKNEKPEAQGYHRLGGGTWCAAAARHVMMLLNVPCLAEED